VPAEEEHPVEAAGERPLQARHLRLPVPAGSAERDWWRCFRSCYGGWRCTHAVLSKVNWQDHGRDSRGNNDLFLRTPNIPLWLWQWKSQTGNPKPEFPKSEWRIPKARITT